MSRTETLKRRFEDKGTALREFLERIAETHSARGMAVAVIDRNGGRKLLPHEIRGVTADRFGPLFPDVSFFRLGESKGRTEF